MFQLLILRSLMFNYEGKTLLKCRPEKERLVEPFLGAVSSIFPPRLQMRTRRKACSRACAPLGYKIKKPDKEYKKAKNVYPPASCDEGNVTLLSGNNALEFSGGAETPKWKFRKFVTRNVQL